MWLRLPDTPPRTPPCCRATLARTVAAVQEEGRALRGGVVGQHPHARLHPSDAIVQKEVEVDGVDEVGGRLVVLRRHQWGMGPARVAVGRTTAVPHGPPSALCTSSARQRQHPAAAVAPCGGTPCAPWPPWLPGLWRVLPQRQTHGWRGRGRRRRRRGSAAAARGWRLRQRRSSGCEAATLHVGRIREGEALGSKEGLPEGAQAGGGGDRRGGPQGVEAAPAMIKWYRRTCAAGGAAGESPCGGGRGKVSSADLEPGSARMQTNWCDRGAFQANRQAHSRLLALRQ